MDQTLIESPRRGSVDTTSMIASDDALPRDCFHCGEPCRDSTFEREEKTFCCQGCLVVHDLLAESGLGHFYDLGRHPGVRIRQPRNAPRQQWAFLDELALQQRLLDFTDGKVSRVTFHVPAIHCVACVWLLENLFQLHPGIGRSQVNFPRREVAISFETARLKLSELVALLASIGYEPQLTLGELEKSAPDPLRKRQWLQVGIAGFAFGNIMLFSLPTYLGLDSLNGPLFKTVFAWLSLALAVPVLVYSASDYWRSALLSFRQRILTLDVPIALGLAALYAQSLYDISSGRGEGYLDSLAGLIFFLLCGRIFQQKTQDRLSFDRDYKSFFPLSVMRQTPAGEESVALYHLRVGDRLLVRNGELLPADAILLNGDALIDYSFVTGESEPVSKQPGDYLYAGGRQAGETIHIETVKPVSQSYLTSLWDHEAFRKQRDYSLNTLTNRYSRRFIRIVLAVAVGAALFWFLSGDAARALKAFTSVLIVACPCALALAAPFTLGTARRLLARVQVFLKNALVLERMAQVDAIVFDKTGTLTSPHGQTVNFHCGSVVPALAGPPGVDSSAFESSLARRAKAGTANLESPLSNAEKSWLHSLTQHSTHPCAVRIAEWAKASPPSTPHPSRLTPHASRSSSFAETPGFGISAAVEGHLLRLGSRAWLESDSIRVPELALPAGSVSYVAIDGAFRGAFVLSNTLRPETGRLVNELGRNCELTLLSGDNEKERESFRNLFGSDARLHFKQSPLDKLTFIRSLQSSGKTVMMVGDGLNDAGALQQSDVGVAVVERVGVFSPASDVILEAGQVPRLFQIMALSRKAARIVRLSFGISALYNLVGISVAAAGILSPLICAVLMPLSSISVVLFACGATAWAARGAGLKHE
jgi:Cu+-exporting ATPase